MKDIKWIFFDVGSTLIDETNAYEKRFQEIAGMAGRSYENIVQEALLFYQQNKKGDLEMRLQNHGILQYIDLVVASAEEGVAKPDLRIFEIALERSGCRPENPVKVKNDTF